MLYIQVSEWLAGALPEGAAIGIDPLLHTIDSAAKLGSQLEEAGKTLVPLTANPVDDVWGSERPAAPKAPLRVHAMEWAGVSVTDKLNSLRSRMSEVGTGATIVAMLGTLVFLNNNCLTFCCF